MDYPRSYHAAVNHLVAFGGHGGPVNGRHLVARALVDMRRKFGRKAAMRARGGMLFISGQFPVKRTR